VIEEKRVQLPLDVARPLFAVYDTWWNKIGTFDPGTLHTADGTEIPGIVLSLDDDNAMDEAAGTVEPHEPLLRSLLFPGETT